MYSSNVKRLHDVQAARDASYAASWTATAFALLAWFGYGQGWFDGGVADGNPVMAVAIGYGFGAFAGFASATGSHQDESFDSRERALEKIRIRWLGDPDGMRAEARRLRREAIVWSPALWPFTITWRLVQAHIPVRAQSA